MWRKFGNDYGSRQTKNTIPFARSEDEKSLAVCSCGCAAPDRMCA